MGIWEKPSDDLLDSLEKEFHFLPPREHGVDTIECIHAMMESKVKVFFALGGNFYRATPDHDRTALALSNCELTVQVSTKLNQSHLYVGKSSLILPTLGRTEIDRQASGIQTVTVENSMGVVQTSHGKIPPASSHLKSEVAIVAELAKHMQPESVIDWLALRDDYSRIREHIAAVIPGFNDFNRKINQYGEFVLPNPVRDNRVFNTKTQKANFVVQTNTHRKLQDNQLLMMTIRSHDQFNTTIYSDNDRYRGIAGSREVIFVNKEDMTSLGFQDGEYVDIESHDPMQPEQSRRLPRFKLVTYPIPKGCVAGYYPETNNLVSLAEVADKSNTPAYKSIVVTLCSSQKDGK